MATAVCIPYNDMRIETRWRLDFDALSAHDSFSGLFALAKLLRDERETLASLMPMSTMVIFLEDRGVRVTRQALAVRVQAQPAQN